MLNAEEVTASWVTETHGSEGLSGRGGGEALTNTLDMTRRRGEDEVRGSRATLTVALPLLQGQQTESGRFQRSKKTKRKESQSRRKSSCFPTEKNAPQGSAPLRGEIVAAQPIDQRPSLLVRKVFWQLLQKIHSRQNYQRWGFWSQFKPTRNTTGTETADKKNIIFFPQISRKIQNSPPPKKI